VTSPPPYAGSRTIALFHVVVRLDVATGWQKTDRHPLQIRFSNTLEDGGVVLVSSDIRALQTLTCWAAC
jgi:hypothetical protein